MIRTIVLLVVLALAWPVAWSVRVAVTGSGTPVARRDAALGVVVSAAGTGALAAARARVLSLGGSVTRELPIVDGFAATLPAGAADAVRAVRGVRSVTPDTAVRTSLSPLASAGDGEPTSVYPAALRADRAWAAGDRGQGVTVAVLDTGVTAAQDLSGRLVTVTGGAPNGAAAGCKNLSGEPSCTDTYGHGTFVAGVVAGDGAASGGRWTGVAPASRILSVKVAGRDGSTDVSNVLAAIQWVVSYRATYGIRVLNLSLSTDSTQSYRTDPFNYAVERAWDAGIVVVVSASNRGPDPATVSKPGDDPLVVTVGASDDRGTPGLGDDELPDFSSRGPTVPDGLTKPDVVAPGAHLMSLRSPGSTIDVLHPETNDGAYHRGSGTSFSSAAVSGVAALMLSRNPSMTPNQVKHALLASARPLAAGADPQQVGAGVVDAAAAALTPPAGSANAGVVRSNGTGVLQASRGHVNVQTDTSSSTVVNGALTAQLLLWDPTGYLFGWSPTTWVVSPWAVTPWQPLRWADGDWSGRNWGGRNWGGGDWQGTTAPDGSADQDRDFGLPTDGALWFGAWGVAPGASRRGIAGRFRKRLSTFRRERGVLAWSAVLAATAAVSGTAAQALAGPPAPAGSRLAWGLIGLALVVAGTLTIEIRHRGEIEAFDVFEVALAPAVYFLAGLEAVLLVAGAKVVSQLALRMPPAKLGFNVVQWAACAGCGALVLAGFTRAGLPEAGLVAAMIVVALANLVALVGLFGVLDGRQGVRQLLQPRALAWSASGTGVTTLAGLGITLAAVDRPQALLFVIALPVLLHRAGRGYALARADLDRMRSLQAGTRALSAVHDVRLNPAPFLAEVARSCRALGAELALRGAGGIDSYRHAISSRPAMSGAAAESALTRSVLAERLPLHAVARPRSPAGRWPPALQRVRRLVRAVSTGPGVAPPPEPDASAGVTTAVRDAGWRDCLAVPLQIDGQEAGVLAVYDRSGFAELDQADLAVLTAMGREVASAIQRAELVGEIIGARRDAARIVESSNDGIVAIADDGSVVTWNPAFAALTGHPLERVLGPDGLDLLDARDADGLPVPLAAWASGAATPEELSVRAAGGRRCWLSCSYARTSGDDGRLLVVMARDVTDLRRQRDLIVGQGQVLELIAADQPLAVSLDAVGQLVRRQLDSPAAVLLVEGDGAAASLVPPAGTSGDAFPDAATVVERLNTVPPERWARAAAAGRPVARPPSPSPSSWSAARPCWALPIFDGRQAGMLGAVTVRPAPATVLEGHTLEVLRTAGRLAGVALDRDAARTRLTHQASHDPLTGLPNRTVFLDRCAHALLMATRRDELAVVLFVDLDRFKVINDSLGHEAGDRLLVAVGERLRLAVRPSDTIARFGGDEFTILCEQLQTPRDARILAERVLGLFATPFVLDGREVFETASVGIALGRSPQRPEDLVQHADAAMYRAKAGGGNRFEFFDDKLRREAQERLSDYAALRRAVEGAEFEVHYQPTFALADGRPVGMEALARWRHPVRGLLRPDAFIDLAEETGLIVPLGRQILTTVLAELPPCGPGRPRRVSVNLSARQLTQPDIAATVERALEVAGVPPDRLALEITESLLLTDSSAMQTVIGQLKRIGVDLSLDDFGTGHSSMDYLKFLPVDELKIERRFVAGLLTDHRDQAIVSAITNLAHDLGLRVVAEGVESAAQADLLRDLGCDVGQGYYFGRPGPMGPTGPIST